MPSSYEYPILINSFCSPSRAGHALTFLALVVIRRVPPRVLVTSIKTSEGLFFSFLKHGFFRHFNIIVPCFLQFCSTPFRYRFSLKNKFWCAASVLFALLIQFPDSIRDRLRHPSNHFPLSFGCPFVPFAEGFFIFSCFPASGSCFFLFQ